MVMPRLSQSLTIPGQPRASQGLPARRSCPSNTSAGSAVTPDFRGTWSLWTMRRPRPRRPRQDLGFMLPLEMMRLGGWAIRSQYGIDHMNSPENWEVTGGFLQGKNHSLGVITKARALVSWQRVWVKTRQPQNLGVFLFTVQIIFARVFKGWDCITVDL